MSQLAALAAPILGFRPTAFFLALLVVHIGAGLIAVVTGAVAILSPKRKGRHPDYGTIYCGALVMVFATTSGLAALRWSADGYLFVLGAAAFVAGSAGYAARRVRWPGWLAFHISGMGLSYVVLLTAFWVDNGPRLPVWNHLPAIAFWVLPSLIGIPIIVAALRRHTDVFG